MSFPVNISPEGRQFIKDREALRLKAYKDSAGVWTIGYGHTGPDVKPGLMITEARADDLLDSDLKPAVAGVMHALTREPSQRQFDAMCSLAFNIGVRAFAGSTVVKRFNEGNEIAAADAFGLWRKVTINGRKVDSPGLIKRRGLEKALFLRGTEVPAAPATVAEAPRIAQSGTVKGGVWAAVASVLAGLTAVVKEWQDVLMNLPWVGDLAKAIVAYDPKIAGILASIGILAGIYVIYRRLSDRHAGLV